VIVAARRLLYGAGAVQASLCAPCAFQRNITKYLTDEILDVLARPGGAHHATLGIDVCVTAASGSVCTHGQFL